MKTTTTAAGNTPGRPAPVLPPEVLDLLAAIRDHANVPLPDTDDVAERAWQQVMLQRLTSLHSALDVALSPQWAATTNAADEAAYIRKCTADTPATYALYETKQDGGGQS